MFVAENLTLADVGISSDEVVDLLDELLCLRMHGGLLMCENAAIRFVPKVGAVALFVCVLVDSCAMGVLRMWWPLCVCICVRTAWWIANGQ